MYPLCVRTGFSVHESFASSLKILRVDEKFCHHGPTKCATLSLLVKDWSLVHPWGDTKRQTLSTIRRVCTSAAAPLPPEKCKRHCVGHHALKSSQQSTHKKKTQSIGIDLLLEGDFLRMVVHFFVSKHVHSMSLLYLQIDGEFPLQLPNSL